MLKIMFEVKVIKISESEIPYQTLFQHQHGYVCVTSNMKNSSRKTWQTSHLVLKPLQIETLREKSKGSRHIMSPRLKKWGDTSPVSPTKLRPWSHMCGINEPPVWDLWITSEILSYSSPIQRIIQKKRFQPIAGFLVATQFIQCID